VSPEHIAELAQLGAESTGPGGRHIITLCGRFVRLAHDPCAGSEFAWHCGGMQSGDCYGPTPRAAYTACLYLRAEALAARIAMLQAEAAEIAGELSRVAEVAK
jgi:hypothetical protein